MPVGPAGLAVHPGDGARHIEAAATATYQLKETDMFGFTMGAEGAVILRIMESQDAAEVAE